MQLARIRLTLHGAYKGQTIILNRRQFVNGVLSGTGLPEELANIYKYYTTSYNCTGVIEPIEPRPEPRAVLTPDEPIKRINEQEAHDPEPATPECPTQRQEGIMMAIEGIDQSNWISGPVDHPRVSDVAEILNDPTVTIEEITECIEKWWVDDTKEEEPEIIIPEEPALETISIPEPELMYVQEETIEEPETQPEDIVSIGEPEPPTEKVSEPNPIQEKAPGRKRARKDKE